MFGAGETLDEVLGLIDTAEKLEEILVKALSTGGARQSLGSRNLRDLADRFGVTPLPEALAIEGWRTAQRGA